MQNEANPPQAKLLDRLRTMFPTAKTQTLKRMVAAGRVTVGRRRATKLSETVPEAAEVRVADEGVTPMSRRPTISPLKVIFEDGDVLVVSKPAGLLTSTVPREPRPTALAIVREYMRATSPQARVGVIHRLDRDASGLLVFSKSHRAYESLKTQFFKHTVEREYEAVVRGTPKPRAGRIKSRLVELPSGQVRSTDRPNHGQEAVTDYELVASEAGCSLLRVKLQTGRKHQIRAHLSERGWPIVGDDVYGTRKGAQPLQLRAVRLAFDHPASGERVVYQVPGLTLESAGCGGAKSK